MMSSVCGISKIDAFTNEFLANMPDLTRCEGWLLASILGYSRRPCDGKIVVTDLASEMDMCRDCWNEYQRGNWRY